MNRVMRCFKIFFFVSVLFWSITIANAQSDAVFKMSIDKPMNDIYDKVYASLEESRFYVVFEPDIGKNLAGFAERWGDEYNQNKLSGLRSMVFCNAWYANQVSNKDPDLLGLCPLHLSVLEKNGKTTILFNKPTAYSANSPAHSLIQEIENKVIHAVKNGMR